MKKQQTPHGALRARTRAFFCALTLALLCITTPAKAQIWGNEPTTGGHNGVVLPENVTFTQETIGAVTRYQLKLVGTGSSAQDKGWICICLNNSVSISSIDDFPAGTYPINNSGEAGTALASQGLTGEYADRVQDWNTVSIIGTGYRTIDNYSTYNWHAKTGNVYVIKTEDGLHNIIFFTMTSCHNPEQTPGSIRVSCTPDGKSIATYSYATHMDVCGSGTTTASSCRFARNGTITATPAAGVSFVHWVDGEGNLIGTDNPHTFTEVGPYNITAVFSDGIGCPSAAPVTLTYDVACTVSPAGAGTVTGTGTFDEGDDVALTAYPANRRYVFSHWTDEDSSAGTDGVATYSINSIAADHNNVVAVFTEVPVTIADNEESSYYSTTLSTFTGSMDFQLMRTFYAGMWNTVCFPFDLTAPQIDNSDMSDATFYTLSSVTGDPAEGLDFNVSEVTALSARTPYLVQVSGANIVNPVFKDVTLAASAFTNNTTGTNVGDTRFFGTVHPTALEVGENSGYLFLGQNNALYWPNVANDIRAFRAYFYSGDNTVQAVHPRVRLVVRPETPTDVIEGYNADTRSAVGLPVPARKVLDNGNLIIERDGIRYNAVGQRVN